MAITLGWSGTHRTMSRQTVWTRTTWAGEWQRQPDIHCSSAVWPAAPQMPTAELIFDYGLIKSSVVQFYTTETDVWWPRVFVKIRFEQVGANALDTRTLYWVGMVELREDLQGGLATHNGATVASGKVLMTAYGVELALQRGIVDQSHFVQNGGAVQIVERGLTFNDRGIDNRSKNKQGASYHFETDADETQAWSTRNIVEYLLRYHTWSDRAGTPIIPITLDAPRDLVTDLDEPVLYAQGQRTYNLIEQLMPRQRLIGWRLKFDPANDQVTLAPYSYAVQAINLGGGIFPANADPIDRVDFDRDSTAVSSVKTSLLDRADQVIVRGRRVRYTASVSYPDATLENGWPANLTTTYNTAASADAVYPAATEVEERRRLNAEARGREEVRNVFRRHQLTVGIGGNPAAKVGGGLGNEAHLNPAFPGKQGNVNFPVFDLDLYVLQTLPFVGNVDYTGNPALVIETDGDGVERPPLLVFKRPGTGDPGKWVHAEHAGLRAESPRISDDELLRWTAHIQIPPRDRAFLVEVSGAPQHVIASGGDFSPIAGDPADDIEWGEWDYKTGMIATVSYYGGYYCEGRYPANADVPLAPNPVTRHVIVAGDGYRLDRILPHTVVGVDSNGDLERSTGGVLHDDRPLLERVARIAYEWLSGDRYTLSLQTDDVHDDLSVGRMIVRIGAANEPNDQVINSVITEVRIDAPEGTPGSGTVIRQTIQTGAVELDALRLGVTVNAPPPPPAPANPAVNPGQARAFPDRSAGLRDGLHIEGQQ